MPPLLPPSASTVSGELDLLFAYITAISVFFAVGIAVALAVLAVLYRRKPGDGPPPQIHGSTALELVWTVIPLLIVMSFFVWGTDLFFRMRTPPIEPLEIFVVGKQWMWKIQHQEGPREINELHIPVGQPIKLTMTSEDVIHSFSVPAFRVKQDVLPGRYTTMWFEATKTGTFHLFCTEYCGTEHAGMGGSIIVMEPNEYQVWLGGGGAGESLTDAGERLFGQLGCATCHGDQAGARGPSLTGVYNSEVSLAGGGSVTADESYLRESILEPATNIVAGYDAIMPTYRGQISEEGVLQLVAYIRSLGDPAAAGATGAAAAGEAGQ
ncbi:MAG: cytochrome c oxidase subunit II [Acidobacteria bacterium]|nr:cytochrome c oxidase subunit II [Acidobacteriota bacterium]